MRGRNISTQFLLIKRSKNHYLIIFDTVKSLRLKRGSNVSLEIATETNETFILSIINSSL